MTIRFIGGMWRRIDGNNIKSFTTYQGAVDNRISWEDIRLTTTDDIIRQMEAEEIRKAASATRRRSA